MTKKFDILQNRPRRGHVVLFVARSGKIRLGEVLADPIAAQEELQVQDAGNARSRIKFRDVILNLGAAKDGFNGAQQQIEKLAGEIDLELLLESHAEWRKSAAISIGAITEEYFGKEAESQQEAAMYLALQRDNRFTLSGEKAQYRPPAPKPKQKRSEPERQQLFESLRATMTAAMQHGWGAAEINAHPLGKNLVRLAQATLEQRRRYPETWRKEFVLHLHSLNTLTGYRDARHLLFYWLQKIGRVPAHADLFIFSEPLLRQHERRLQQPAVSERLPVISDQWPVSSNQWPVISDQKSEITDKQQTTSNQQPATSDQQPATSDQQPATSDQPPATSDQQPATSDQPPATSDQQPATSDQYRASSIQPNSTATERPAFVITIDNPETTDRDDAISFCRTESGIEIGVHTPLLDVLVPRGTLFDEWAYDVGASAYLPHRRVPMLPEKIASDLGSLNAGQERPVLSIYFELSDAEPPRPSRLVCEQIKIELNTDYDNVDRLLPEASWEKLAQTEINPLPALPSDLGGALRAWANAAVLLEEQRLANGAKIFRRDDVDVRVGANGVVHLRHISRDSVAHKMVAEWMIAANQAAAQFCHENDLPCIYRVQETLVPEREDDDGGRAPVRAQLKPERAPHRDLGVDGYTQITSPLRRYGDLVMQRQIVGFLQTGKPQYSQTDLWARAMAMEEMTRRIQRLESRADFYWKCVYLSQHLGETLRARIGRSARIILHILDLDLRLYVPPSGIEGIDETKIPPHYSPKEVQAICLEMNADKATMRFQIKEVG